MAVTIEDCNKVREDIKKEIEAVAKLITDSSEYEVIKGFDNPHQVNAYKIKKKQETYSGLFKLILKIASEISVITGAISVLLGIFV